MMDAMAMTAIADLELKIIMSFLPMVIFETKGETCKRFFQTGTAGRWKFIRMKNELLLEITLATKNKIKFRVLYFDREGNMVADRQ